MIDPKGTVVQRALEYSRSTDVSDGLDLFRHRSGSFDVMTNYVMLEIKRPLSILSKYTELQRNKNKIFSKWS